MTDSERQQQLQEAQELHVRTLPSLPPPEPGRIVADGGGLRLNDGKLPLELVPPEAIRAMAEVLRYGAKKYAPRNWERGMDWLICYGCAQRHLLQWFERLDVDHESGLNHLKHALTNIAFLIAYEERQTGTDNRPLYQKGT